MDGPSKILLGAEGIRAAYEYGMGWLLNLPLQHIVPKGDGHTVMVLPGLGTADGSTHYIRNFIENIGYTAVPWGLGRNLGPRQGLDKLMAQLSDRLDEEFENSGNQEVTLLGWSLGGIYGRELAKISPKKVRQVITLGTPFKNSETGTNATMLYEMLCKDSSHKNPDVIKQIGIKPPVPFTSLYSKSDGVVHWECSIEEESDISQNIEIPAASHLGLGHNPVAMYVVGNRLNQKKDSWIHYKF